MKKLVQLSLVALLVMSGYVGSAIAAGRGDSHGVIGKKVKDHQGRVIGTVKNIVLTDEGCVQYVILSGEARRSRDKLYPVPWTVFSTNDRREYYTVRINEDALREAPSFTTSSWPDFSAPTWSTNVTNFYQTRINVNQNAPDSGIDVKGKSDTSSSKASKKEKASKKDRRTSDTDMKSGVLDDSSKKKESATSSSKKSDSSDTRKDKEKADKEKKHDKADTEKKSKSDHDRSNGKALNTDSSTKGAGEASKSMMKDKMKTHGDSGMMSPQGRDVRDSGAMRNDTDAGRSAVDRPSMGGPSMGGGPAGSPEKPENPR